MLRLAARVARRSKASASSVKRSISSKGAQGRRVRTRGAHSVAAKQASDNVQSSRRITSASRVSASVQFDHVATTSSRLAATKQEQQSYEQDAQQQPMSRQGNSKYLAIAATERKWSVQCNFSRCSCASCSSDGRRRWSLTWICNYWWISVIYASLVATGKLGWPHSFIICIPNKLSSYTLYVHQLRHGTRFWAQYHQVEWCVRLRINSLLKVVWQNSY